MAKGPLSSGGLRGYYGKQQHQVGLTSLELSSFVRSFEALFAVLLFPVSWLDV